MTMYVKNFALQLTSPPEHHEQGYVTNICINVTATDDVDLHALGEAVAMAARAAIGEIHKDAHEDDEPEPPTDGVIDLNDFINPN